MSKSKKIKPIDINKKCDKNCTKKDGVCKNLKIYDDKRSISENSSLVFRAIYCGIAWFIMGKAISEGNGFFTSIILFASPLLIDYIKFIPSDIIRRNIKIAGMILSLLWIIFGFLGLSNILIVNTIGDMLVIQVAQDFIILKGVYVGLKGIWLLLGISASLTTIDYFAYRTKMEDYIYQFETMSG